MFGINAGKKHVGKPKKAAYKEKRKPVTNIIGFSSQPTSAKKLPRVDVQAEQAVAAPVVQTNIQYDPQAGQQQTASIATEEIATPYGHQTQTAERYEAAPEWQAATSESRPQETTEPKVEETTEAFEMTTAESRWESAQPQQWIPEQQAPTGTQPQQWIPEEQAATERIVTTNKLETEPATHEASWRDQEAAAVTDRILSEIEDWTPMLPDPANTRDEYQYREEAFSQPDEQRERLAQLEASEQYYTEPEQTVRAETTEPETNTEASGYQQLEYYIEDPSDLQADDSVWSPVVSGVVRVPVRPVTGPAAGVEYQPASEVGEPVQPQVEEEEYAEAEPVEPYLESVQETSFNAEEYEAPQLEAQVDEPFLEVKEYTPTSQEPDEMSKPVVSEPEPAQNVNRPPPSSPFRPPEPQTPQQFFQESPGPRPAGGAAPPTPRPRLPEPQPPQRFFEEGPGPRPAGGAAPPTPRPRPRPTGGWVSGLLSGLFGNRSSGPGSSGGSSGGGSGGLLAGLFRRPTSTAATPTGDELPPVQSDPILAAMFGAQGGQSGEGDGEVSAETPAGRQDATEGRPESVSPTS